MSHSSILVVEDEYLVAQDLQETLESLGYEVSANVTTGEEALQRVEVVVPDLILMDIRLAGKIDGIQTYEKISSRFQVPVVYLTASADRPTLERVKATHPFGYIVKPFDDRTLLTTIEIALSRHKVEQSLHQSSAVANEALLNKAQLLSMAAHEFRNPLATIRFTTEVLQRYQQIPPEKRQRHLDRIHAAVVTLDELLEDLLVLGRSDRGRLNLSLETLDITAQCEAFLETFQYGMAREHALYFSSTNLPLIAEVDEKLLWHLLNNLLTNAVKYSPQGSQIWLTLSGNSQQVCLQVKDEGIGIPPEEQSRLFEPFYRAENVAEVQGTGLGLAIAKQCVDLHGGTIAVDSYPGQGSTFTVSLPRHPGNASSVCGCCTPEHTLS